MRWLAALVVPACLQANLVPCGDVLCPTDKVCALDGTCVDPERIVACASAAEGDSCTFGVSTGLCHAGICDASTCGDAVVSGLEQCDGAELRGATCLTYGFYEPEGLACSTSCAVDTSACIGRCGDGVVNGPELCDTVPRDVFTCYEVGYDIGSVACSPALCAPTYADCKTIGWKSHVHHYDYAQHLWSPRLGETYLLGGMTYLYVNGYTSTTVDIPTECASFDAAVWATAAHRVYVAGLNGVCINDQGTWTTTTLNNATRLTGIWGTSDTDIWAVGDVVLHFDGSTWSVVDVGAPPNTTFSAVYGRAGGTIAAISTSGVAVNRNGVWTYTPNLEPFLSGLWVSTTGSVYVAGTDGGLGSSIFVNRSGTWNQLVGAPYATWIWGLSDAAIYVAGGDLYTYDGVAWLPVDGPNSLSGFGGGDDHLVAVEGYDHLWESAGYVWTPTISAPSAVNALWAFSTADLFAFADNHMMHWDGEIWTTTLAPFTVETVWGAGHTIFAAAAHGTNQLATYDGTWHVKQFGVETDFATIVSEVPDRVFAFGLDNNVHQAIIWMHDGISWSRVYVEDNTYGFTASCSSALGTFAAINNTGHLYHHALGDPTSMWTSVGPPAAVQGLVYISGLWCDDTRVIVTLGDTTSYQLVGDTWSMISSHAPDNPKRIIGGHDDAFGTSDGDLVHWDGFTWDRVRLPVDSGFAVASSVFSGNGVMAVGGPGMLVQLIRPK